MPGTHNHRPPAAHQLDTVCWLIPFHQIPHQATADDIITAEFMNIDIIEPGDALDRIGKAVLAVDITLLDVTIHYNLAVFTNAGQEHFHLRNSRVLGFIQNHKSALAKCLATHIGQRRGNNAAVPQMVIYRTRSQSLVKCVSNRLNINRIFFVHVPWQKAKLFASFHRRAGENNALYCTCKQGRLLRLQLHNSFYRCPQDQCQMSGYGF